MPGGRWLTLLMNRLDPALFAACFTAWVREVWPDRPDLIAIDGSRRFDETPAAKRIEGALRGKTSRRSHDRSKEVTPLHLVSAFATTGRLVLGQEAVADKSNETTAIPLLLERLAASGSLRGALVSIDAIACNPTVAGAITAAGADDLLAVKANQPTRRAEIESFFTDAPPAELDRTIDLD